MLDRLLIGASLAFSAIAASAAPLYVAYDNFHYAGNVARYTSLNDAQNDTNPQSTTAIATATNGTRSTLPDARDGNIYVASGAVGYDPNDLSYFSTGWYFTTTPASGNGWGNPNNTNTGFVQFYDESATPAVTGGWSNGNTRFTLDVSGGDGDSFNFARLWAAPSLGGPSGDTAGLFRAFHLTLIADFAAAATLNGTTGWYDILANPTAVVGSATGIFENQSTNLTLNGFYAFNFSFAPDSWAAANGATWSDGTTDYPPTSFFAAPGQVPEPGSLVLATLALAGLVLAGRRRRV